MAMKINIIFFAIQAEATKTNDFCANGSHFNPLSGGGGQCENCPVGMGGKQCNELLCGSLTAVEGTRKLLGEKGEGNTTCSCDAGWEGLNCNVCKEDSACYSSSKATGVACEKRGVMANKHYKSCIAELPDFYSKMLADRQVNVLIECLNKDFQPSNLAHSKFNCLFQMFLQQQQQFWCQLNDCQRKAGKNANSFAYFCPQSACSCIQGKDIELCSSKKLIDLSPLLQGVSGEASVECNQERCIFSQGNLNDFFQSGIQMRCTSGECLSPDILPGLLAPKSNILIKIVYWMGIGLFVSLMCGFLGLFFHLLAFDRRILQEKQEFLALPPTSSSSINHHHNSSLAPQTCAGYKLTFSDIHYSLPVFPFRVLSGVTGFVRPGEILGIMGNSGCGKTTLLEILGQKNKSGIIDGYIFLNDVVCSPCQRGEMRKISGFVEQEDVLMGTLTVRESLSYSAHLRLSEELSLEEKRQRIDEILTELGIFHIQHSLIGTAGIRGISGGEKRRVMIAQELCSRPSILFLDEPTSGLDSSTALSLVRTLSHLAKVHRMTIIMTIHQPRSNIFALLDSLLLLSTQGRQIYFGEGAMVGEYFGKMNFHCPEGYNIADFVMDVCCGEVLANEMPFCHSKSPFPQSSSSLEIVIENAPLGKREASEERTQKLASFWQESDEFALVKSEIPDFDSFSASFLHQIHSISHSNGGGKSPSSFHSFCILSCRTMRNIYRNPYLLASHYSISIILALFCGTLFWNITNDMAGVQNRLGCIFFICAFFAFSSMTCLEFFSSERSLFLRERSNGFYSPGPWYFAKGLFDLVPLRIIPPIIFMAICYPMVGLVASWENFFKLLLALVFFNLACASTSLAIGIVVEQLAIANLIASIWILFSMLFGGFLLNKERVSPWLGWLKYLSLFNWAFEAMIITELGKVTLKDRSIVDIAVPGSIILRQFGFNTNAYNADVIALISATMIVVAIGYVALVIWVKERR